MFLHALMALGEEAEELMTLNNIIKSNSYKAGTAVALNEVPPIYQQWQTKEGGTEEHNLTVELAKSYLE